MTAKTGTGIVEAIRVTNAARRSAMKARTEVIVQLKSLIVTAPESIRTEFRDLTTTRLITRLAGSRAHVGDDQFACRTGAALKRLAVRYRQLDEEIAGHDTDLAQLVDTVNPALTQARGIATVTAAQLLITAGDNRDRLRFRGSFRDALRSLAPAHLLRENDTSPTQPRRRPGRELRAPQNRDRGPGHRPRNSRPRDPHANASGSASPRSPTPSAA